MENNWSKVALLRKEQIESGLDITFIKVFAPKILFLIDLYKPESIIEVDAIKYPATNTRFMLKKRIASILTN